MQTTIAGTLLRSLRLEKNWSQETLCHGICGVSYLSKIEQGKVDANPRLLEDLFARLGVTWQESVEITALRDNLYESIFSWDQDETDRQMRILDEKWPDNVIGPCYADFVVMRAYHHRKAEWVPRELEPLLDRRQRALYALTQNRHDDAYRAYPCPLTAFCVAEEAYQKGNYTQALEYLQITSDQAAREGYVYLQMYGQHYMCNCYSDMGNLDAMYRHGKIAARIGKALGLQDLVDTVSYNIAATKAEFGDFEGAYAYFSNLEAPKVMDLHKLAVCCEAMGRTEEAISSLNRADQLEPGMQLEKEMCALVRYRLEHPDYLHDADYGELLLTTFEKIKMELHAGFARFHLRWLTQWLTANRQYRKAFEILRDFPENYV